MSAQPEAARASGMIPTAHELARRALFAFLLTFILARALVFLIMARRIPNLYFFLHDTHVHHLNYGIFLLAGVGAYLLFRAPTGDAARRAAFAYGIAMALTFDEFGMWLHLGGSYWQRASIDASVVVAAVLAFIAYARSIETFEARHVPGFHRLRHCLAHLRRRALRGFHLHRQHRGTSPARARAGVIALTDAFPHSSSLSSSVALQRCDDCGLIGRHRCLQRPGTAQVRKVGIGARRQQRSNSVSLTVQRRQHQRRAAEGVTCIDIHLLREQRLKCGAVADFRSALKCCGALRRSC